MGKKGLRADLQTFPGCPGLVRQEAVPGGLLFQVICYLSLELRSIFLLGDVLVQELSHLLGSGAVGGSEDSHRSQSVAQAALAMFFSSLLSHLKKNKNKKTRGTSCFETPGSCEFHDFSLHLQSGQACCCKGQISVLYTLVYTSSFPLWGCFSFASPLLAGGRLVALREVCFPSRIGRAMGARAAMLDIIHGLLHLNPYNGLSCEKKVGGKNQERRGESRKREIIATNTHTHRAP